MTPAPAPLQPFLPLPYPRAKRIPDLTREQLYVVRQLLALGRTLSQARRLARIDHTAGVGVL